MNRKSQENEASAAARRGTKIAAHGLGLIYLGLLAYVGDVAQLGIATLLLVAIRTLDNRYHEVEARSTASEKLLGVGLLLAVIASWVFIALAGSRKMDLLDQPIPFAVSRVSPWLGGIGLVIWEYGFRSIPSFWRSLTILFFLGVPSVLLSGVDLSLLTCGVSTGFLQLAGWDAQRDGVLLSLSGGTVRVYRGCAGLESMLYLLGLAVTCVTVFPVGRAPWLYSCFLAFAVVVGFCVNAVRVALMAVLVSRQQLESFEYWHVGEGSLLFGMMAVSIVGSVYAVALWRYRRSASELRSPSDETDLNL